MQLEVNTIFLTPPFKFNKSEMINNDQLLNTNEKSVDPNDLHISRCGKNSFKKLRIYKIHSNYDWNRCIRLYLYQLLLKKYLDFNTRKCFF